MYRIARLMLYLILTQKNLKYIIKIGFFKGYSINESYYMINTHI